MLEKSIFYTFSILSLSFIDKGALVECATYGGLFCSCKGKNAFVAYLLESLDC